MLILQALYGFAQDLLSQLPILLNVDLLVHRFRESVLPLKLEWIQMVLSLLWNIVGTTLLPLYDPLLLLLVSFLSYLHFLLEAWHLEVDLIILVCRSCLTHIGWGILTWIEALLCVRENGLRLVVTSDSPSCSHASRSSGVGTSRAIMLDSGWASDCVRMRDHVLLSLLVKVCSYCLAMFNSLIVTLKLIMFHCCFVSLDIGFPLLLLQMNPLKSLFDTFILILSNLFKLLFLLVKPLLSLALVTHLLHEGGLLDPLPTFKLTHYSLHLLLLYYKW